MPAVIQKSDEEFSNPDVFISAVMAKVDRAIDKAIIKFAKRTKKRWRQKSDSSDVRGNFSKVWKDKKGKLGLRTEHMQRFGRGDSRSMYENLTIKRFDSGKGWFVGIPLGPKAFNFKGIPTGEQLADVASALEEGSAPGVKGPKLMWTDILAESPPILTTFLITSLVQGFRELGVNDIG